MLHFREGKGRMIETAAGQSTRVRVENFSWATCMQKISIGSLHENNFSWSQSFGGKKGYICSRKGRSQGKGREDLIIPIGYLQS